MVSSTQGSLIMGSQCKRGLPKMLLLMLLQLQRVGGSFASPLGKTSGWQKPKEPILDVAYEVKYGGSPRLITVDC